MSPERATPPATLVLDGLGTAEAASDGAPEPTLRERALHALRNAILSGALSPGSRLNEVALADELALSRGPLREALRELASESLVETVPYRGTFVARLTERDVEEVFSMRTVLETFAFKLAWPRRTREFGAELEARHDRLLRTVAAGDFTGAIEAELALHDVVYAWADHAILLQSWTSLRNRLQLYFAAHQRAHGRAGPARDGDARYVELAGGQDLDAMLAEVYLHMRKGLERVRAFVRERQA